MFTWRMLAATASQEELSDSDYRALQNQVEERQRPLGKKTIEGEILKLAQKSFVKLDVTRSNNAAGLQATSFGSS
ncbi:hypothetical protein ISN39_34890 (plasmid) [Rhizobium sp. 007]|nr:hypothetical protein ISN39_34890 [Rhizobium sp. 007]